VKKQDIRWMQRFETYKRVLLKLNEAVQLANSRGLTELEKQGLIQSFEYTHELAWNLMKDYLSYQGIQDIVGSRDASRHAFNKGLVMEGEIWMEMIKSRNLTSHTYSQDIADNIVEKIKSHYIDAFLNLDLKFNAFKDK
jgi:nucleotidyltransferase substrate binding protein (TIGR01987 family)